MLCFSISNVGSYIKYYKYKPPTQFIDMAGNQAINSALNSKGVLLLVPYMVTLPYIIVVTLIRAEIKPWK